MITRAPDLGIPTPSTRNTRILGPRTLYSFNHVVAEGMTFRPGHGNDLIIDKITQPQPPPLCATNVRSHHMEMTAPRNS